ncbi:hypothetical protein [Peribacillus simplex]|uniref:hypothetical protein n=1 Tax=Peribacillus simplex TaxID=1478 RepID=UPI000931E52C|nr:hypothetical protein [Peribacillus simplex]
MITARKTRIQIQQTSKWERIRNYEKKNAIINLEEAWERYAVNRLTDEDLATNKMIRHVTILSMIDKTANRFYKAWKKNSRLSLHDFQSVLYERVWHIVGSYSWFDDYFLYEQLNKGLQLACIDLLRSEGLVKKRRNRHTYFHNSSALTYDDNLDVELIGAENVELKALLNVAINQDLDDKEKRVAKLLLAEREITLDDICTELGLKYRMQAKRIVNKVHKILQFDYK